jgi:uncharacterized UPF0160 family protein
MEKKPKVVIATHSGKFHADDVFATATLSLVLEKKHEVEIIRTRDREKINLADFAVDVGDNYDPDKNRFDHHQHGGAGTHDNGIPYAAFGLVWKKYGEELSGNKENAERLEYKLVMPIDAPDNGIKTYTTLFKKVEPYSIADVIDVFKVTWKEDPTDIDSRFMYLHDIAKNIIRREIQHIKDNNEARQEIELIYKATEDKRLIIFDRYYPSDEMLSSYSDTLLSIFPQNTDGTWLIKIIRDENNFINSRISLPRAWSGLRDSELEAVTGVSGAIFCHKDLFLAVAKTKEGAIELAHIALREAGK